YRGSETPHPNPLPAGERELTADVAAPPFSTSNKLRSRLISLSAHDLFRKPLRTFRDHTLSHLSRRIPAPCARPHSARCRGRLGLRPCSKDEDLGSNGCAAVEIDDILIEHPNAAGRYAPADRVRLVRAMDPVQRVFVALPQIQGTSSKRIVRASGDAKSA